MASAVGTAVILKCFGTRKEEHMFLLDTIFQIILMIIVNSRFQKPDTQRG